MDVLGSLLSLPEAKWLEINDPRFCNSMADKNQIERVTMKIKTKMDKIKAVIQNYILKTKHFFKMVVNKLQEIHKDNQEKK